MVKVQRYVSDELTHFVGKDLPDENDQYKLLIDIINSGWLTHPPHENSEKNSGGLTLSSHSKISENQMYSPEVICFCDIPVEDLGIHITKYSRFGLSFIKSFLINKGANPVFYVSRGSMVKVWPNANDPNNYSKVLRSELYDNMIINYRDLIQDLMIYFKDLFYQSTEVIRSNQLQDKIGDFQSRVLELEKFLDFHIFSYVKFFDSSKSEDDPENYYMEREWRMIGNLNFNVADVCRVFLPEDYSQMFRKDVLNFAGQMIFV